MHNRFVCLIPQSVGSIFKKKKKTFLNSNSIYYWRKMASIIKFIAICSSTSLLGVALMPLQKTLFKQQTWHCWIKSYSLNAFDSFFSSFLLVNFIAIWKVLRRPCFGRAQPVYLGHCQHSHLRTFSRDTPYWP